MEKPRILITGGNGQLGSELRDLAAQYPGYEFIFFDRGQLSITDKKASDAVFEKYRPQFLVNAAAYTAVDKAESEQEEASEVNGTAVGHLAYLCKHYKARFVHISTDYVFNGEKRQALKETDETDPVNAYGASKLLGEYKAQRNNPDSVIIRTSWVYSVYGKNFVKTMMRLMKEKNEISVVNDQFGSPTYAADLAGAVMTIIGHREWLPGIYHYCNEGVTTWYEFASEIKRLTGSACVVHPITSGQFPTPAKRPAYSLLDTTKIRQTYALQLKPWKESLRNCINRLIATG